METKPYAPWIGLPGFMVTPPAARPELLQRRRLLTALEDHLQHYRMILVSAPSGYGKTVAAAQWARTRPGATWVSATTTTDTAGVLRAGLLASLDPADQPRFGSAALGDEPLPLTDLLAAVPRGTILIIDDAHLLDVETVRASIGAESVLESGAISVILVGQTTLDRNYARELATGIATTIGADELAFTAEEITQVVEHLTGRKSPATSARLAADTDGWPVAVRLGALAEEPDQVEHPSGSSECETATFGRSDPTSDSVPNPLLTEYIDTVVLGRFDPDLVAFLLDATTCSRADLTLVQALTKRDDASALLDLCIRSGLFLDRYLDPAGFAVYRWHDVFAVHTRAIAARRDPDRVHHLNRVAAMHLAHDFPASAVRHSLRGNAPELAVEIIEQTWLGLLLTSQTRTLNALCQALPPQLRDRRDVLLIRACCSALLADPDGAQLLRSRADAALATTGEYPSELVECFAEVLLTDDPAAKAAAASAAYAALANHIDDHSYPHAVYLLGWVELRLRRDPERAISLLTTALGEAESKRLPQLAIQARANRAFALVYAGHFRDADTALAELDSAPGFDSGDWQRFDGGLQHFARGYAQHWRGDLAAAFASFALIVDEGGSNSSFLGLGRVYYALTAAALRSPDRYDSAAQILREVNDHDQQGVPWASYKRMAAARLLEARGNLSEARQIADPLLDHDGIPVTHALLADFYRRVGQPSRAYIALGKIKAPQRPRYALVSSLVTLATLEWSAKQTEQARKHLDRALDVAALDDAHFPFLSMDPELTAFLESHASTGTRHEARLTQIFGLRTQHPLGTDSTLTAREQELLNYLRTTMTAQEIADELHVSLNTVKTHQRAIYRKLGVTNRRSAVRLGG